MTPKQRAHWFGIFAEYLSAIALLCKGYRILGLRMRTFGGEIDIAAARRDLLVIVEVKARLSNDTAAEAVTWHKRERLTRAVQALLVQSPEIAGRKAPSPPNIRFDVMTVSPWRWPRHIPDAWR